MFGAKLTLIVLTSQRLARIDLAGPRRRLRVERAMSCPANTATELAAAVAIAFRLGESTASKSPSYRLLPQSRRSVIVLSDDVWNDTITLPLDVTVLLQPAELQQALAIEAENYSGISAFSSKTTSRKLVDASSNSLDTSTTFSQNNTWWVAQSATSDLASISTAALACGFDFVGITHTQAHRLVGEKRDLPPFSPVGPVDLSNLDTQQSLLRFGSEWASALSTEGYELLIQPDSHSSPSGRVGWLQTSAALVTALVCTGIYHSRTAQLESANNQLAHSQKMLAEMDTTARKLRSAQTQWQQLSQKKNATAGPGAQSRLVRKTDRWQADGTAHWLAMFDAMSTVIPDDCWIESWHSTENSSILVGRSLNAQAVHELASRLDESLQDHGWQVQPPRIKPVETNLFDFEVPLRLEAKPGGWQ